MTQSLSESELDAQLLVFPEWKKDTCNDCMAVTRVWSFKNFIGAWEFGGRIAQLAETYDHHPQITVEWGKVSVSWWTHDAGGVTLRDIEMLSLCDHLPL